jgi:hypothetical protein
MTRSRWLILLLIALTGFLLGALFIHSSAAILLVKLVALASLLVLWSLILVRSRSTSA